MDLIAVVFTLFVIANPVGNSPAIVALIKDFDFQRQKKIMLREALIAYLIAIFFQYFGELFLKVIAVECYALTYTGAIILFLVALGMIFPKLEEGPKETKREPCFVPIATPLITGPGLMTTIMIFSQREADPFMITIAITLAWMGVTAALYAAPYMNKFLSKNALLVLEQIMGMVLMMISAEMFIKATTLFMKG